MVWWPGRRSIQDSVTASGWLTGSAADGVVGMKQLESVCRQGSALYGLPTALILLAGRVAD